LFKYSNKNSSDFFVIMDIRCFQYFKDDQHHLVCKAFAKIILRDEKTINTH